MYDAVIFDNDGVLVGRTPFDTLREAAWTAFETAGVVDPDPDHVETVAAGITPEELTSICDTYGLDPAEFWRARDQATTQAQIEDVHAGRKTLYDDLAALRSLEIPLGIVSSNQQATIDFLMDHFNLAARFHTAYGREPTPDGLRRKKPNPHYLEQALDDLGAETALFVGDNESDITAAHAAGIDSAFIRRPHRRDWDLQIDPTYDIRDLHDLVPICVAAV